MLLGEAQRKIKTHDIEPNISEIPKKKPSTRVELISKRTRFSTRFINPDGSFTEEIYNQPMFFQDPSDKRWKRIDNRLQKSTLNPNKFENMANEFKTIFAEESEASNLMFSPKGGLKSRFVTDWGKKSKSGHK